MVENHVGVGCRSRLVRNARSIDWQLLPPPPGLAMTDVGAVAAVGCHLMRGTGRA